MKIVTKSPEVTTLRAKFYLKSLQINKNVKVKVLGTLMKDDKSLKASI